MNFEDYLKESAQKIDEELDVILTAFLKQARETDTKLLPLALGFLNACKGGKRIRGVLVKLGYEIAASHLPGSLREASENKVAPSTHLEGVLRVGAAYEILHTAILAHDDIIDQSELRRGKPSLYQVLGGNHYGVSQALSLGDAGFFLAMKIISQSPFLGEEKNKALTWLSETMLETSIGEMLDVEKVDPITTMKLKTARYTFIGPLVLGAILAGASHPSHLPGENKVAPGTYLEGVLDRLEGFGLNLGIAYQIQDDILDGENLLGELSYCQKKVLEYSLAAKKLIPEVTCDSKYRKLLEEMVEYLVQRTK